MHKPNEPVRHVGSEAAGLVKALLDKMGMTQEDALQKGLISARDMTFCKTGEEIAAAANTMHIALEQKCSALKGQYPKLGTPEASKCVDYKTPEEPAVVLDTAGVGGPAPVGACDKIPSSVYYDYQSCMRTITDLTIIVANIDRKKKFQLDLWQMRQLGFGGVDAAIL